MRVRDTEPAAAIPTLDINMDTAGGAPMYDSDFEDNGGGLFGEDEEMGGSDFGTAHSGAFPTRITHVGAGATGGEARGMQTWPSVAWAVSLQLMSWVAH